MVMWFVMLTENDLHWQARQSGGASTTDWCTHYLSNLSMSTSSRVSVLLLSYLCSLYDILQPWWRRGPRGQCPGLQVILWRHHVLLRFLSRAALRPVWRGVFFVVPTILVYYWKCSRPAIGLESTGKERVNITMPGLLAKLPEVI